MTTVAVATPERVRAFTASTCATYVPREPFPYSWVTDGTVVSTIGDPSPKSHRYFVIAAPRADDACATNATLFDVSLLCVTATETLSATKSCRRPRAVCGDRSPRFAFRPSSPTWSSAAFHVTSGSSWLSVGSPATPVAAPLVRRETATPSFFVVVKLPSTRQCGSTSAPV